MEGCFRAVQIPSGIADLYALHPVHNRIGLRLSILTYLSQIVLMRWREAFRGRTHLSLRELP